MKISNCLVLCTDFSFIKDSSLHPRPCPAIVIGSTGSRRLFQKPHQLTQLQNSKTFKRLAYFFDTFSKKRRSRKVSHLKWYSYKNTAKRRQAYFGSAYEKHLVFCAIQDSFDMLASSLHQKRIVIVSNRYYQFIELLTKF